METLKIKKLHPGAVIPQPATEGSAGMDLHALLDAPVTLAPGQRALIPTGLSIALPHNGYAAMVFPRSWLASKFGVTLSNCVGVIDSDYRGELKVAVSNLGAEEYAIAPGERIAQLVILPVCMLPVEEASALDETRRGAGGFGSTGKE